MQHTFHAIAESARLHISLHIQSAASQQVTHVAQSLSVLRRVCNATGSLLTECIKHTRHKITEELGMMPVQAHVEYGFCVLGLFLCSSWLA